MKQKYYFQKLLLLSLTISLLLISSNNFATDDPNCGTTEMEGNTDFDEWIQLLKDEAQTQLSGELECPLPDSTNGPYDVTIPLAFHFDDDDESERACILDGVLKQIEVLQKDFDSTNDDIQNYFYSIANCTNADVPFIPDVSSDGACIKFCLANKNHPPSSGLVDGEPAITFGEDFSFDDQSDWVGYLNVHITGGTPKSNSTPGMLNGDGVQINNFDCTTGHLRMSLTHEVGHYLGLKHVFQGIEGNEVDFKGQNCNGRTDKAIYLVDDTPLQNSPYSFTLSGIGCVDPSDQDYCAILSTFCVTGEKRQFNHMDYFDNECSAMFTKDQAWAMNKFATSDLVVWANELEDKGCFSPTDCWAGVNTVGFGLDFEITTDWTITENDSWVFDGVWSIPFDIRVLSGNVLTLRDITINFDSRNKIIVENGAKLILDNATLTTGCDQLLWEGIQVEGTSYEPHPAEVTESSNLLPHFGIVFMKNSIIEHAINGIKTIREGETWEVISTNGIVIVEDSYFFNNLCSIVLIGDEYDIGGHTTKTASKIKNTEFTIDQNFRTDNLIDPSVEPIVQVRLKNIVGCPIIESRFKNLSDLSGGKAIWTDDASYTLRYSQVKGFHIGVESIHSGLFPQKHQLLIDGVDVNLNGTLNKFSDNDKNISISGYAENVTDIPTYNNLTSDLGVVITNYNFGFNKPNSNALYGIYVDACANYKISDNTFNDNISASIIANSSESTKTNYIQNNKILTNDIVGVQAANTNSSLQLHCNTFSSDLDYGVYYDDDIQSIAPVQGACDPNQVSTDSPESYPTGNNLATGTNQIQFDTQDGNGPQIIYNHYPGEVPSGAILPNNFMLAQCDVNITKICEFTNGPKTDTDCCFCGRIDDMVNEILEINKYIEQDKSLLTNYNRKDESALIEMATEIEKIESIIDNYDVYLSNKELKAVAQKLGSLPPLGILNILLENAPIQKEVKVGIEDHLNTLPVFVKNFLNRQYGKQFNQLLKQTGGLSLRAEKEINILRYLRAQVETLEPWDGNDDDGDDPICGRGIGVKQYMMEALQKLSKSTIENSLWFKKQEIDYLVKLGEYKQANKILDRLSFETEEELSDYIYLKQLEISLKEEGRGVKDLTKAELIQLEDIKSDNTVEGILARNTLIIHNEGSLELIAPPIPIRNLKENQPAIEGNDNLINTLDVWPNPSNYEINIDLSGTFNVSSQLQIVLFDHTGKQLKELKLPYQKQLKMSIDDIEEGTYILSVIDVVTGNHNKAKILIIR